ncbi:MAG: hypothetical protein AAF399_07230 [Bacteroidota bacterium]
MSHWIKHLRTIPQSEDRLSLKMDLQCPPGMQLQATTWQETGELVIWLERAEDVAPSETQHLQIPVPTEYRGQRLRVLLKERKGEREFGNEEIKMN